MLKASQRAAIVGSVDPVSDDAVHTSGWIDASKFLNFLALIQTGVLGAAATVDAKLQQATDDAGTGAKDVPGKSLAQIVKATGDSKQATIDLTQEDLDFANGFRFLRLSITPAVADSLVSGLVLGFDPGNGLAASSQAATVVQNV